MSQQKKSAHPRQERKNLIIAIAALSCVLAVLLIVGVALAMSGNQSGNPGASESTNGAGQPAQTPGASSNPGTDLPEDPTAAQSTTEPLVNNLPTEENPVLLDQGLYLVHMGNFTGRYVEDGSDAEVENVCAVVVENRSEKTVQLAQFQITGGGEVYDFSLTTLPPGQRVIAQELNKRPLNTEEILTVKVDVLVYFPEEPQLYEDIFAVSGADNSIELRNLTDQEIPGPIYVYYKTRTAEGFAGGITYRITVPTLKAGESYQATATHFWIGSSQVMFIDYAD